MKKFLSLGLCGLLCTMHLTIIDANTPNTSEAREAKTNHILSNVVKVVEGIINIIKIIKDARHDKINIKEKAESELAQTVTYIKNIAAESLTQEELNPESIQELCAMLRRVATSIQPLLREYIKDDVASVHDYLQNAPLQELQQQLQILNQMEEQDLAIAPTDEHEKEFHAHIIQALHNLIQNLFSIIQAPENPKVIGQNIADMLSNIINVASQTLKYEYLSSRDAEENVAIYLESFSNELTKEIKHLMLQTALHLRSCKQIRACCGNNSCNGCCGSGSTVCRPCCNPCNTCGLNMQQEDITLRKSSCCSSCSCSPQCSTTCSSCNNSCCSLRAHGVQEKTVTRACPHGCSKCCCSYGTRKDTAPKEIVRRAIVRNNKRRACTTCNSCGKNCNTCGCKKTVTKNQPTDETKCGCGAKPKPRPNRTSDDANSNDAAKCGCGKPKPKPAVRVEEAQNDVTKCGCGKPRPRPNAPRRYGKTLIFPEGYKG